MNTEIFDLGKIGITIGGEYDNNVIYEKLTIVLYKGKSYISTKTTKGVSPEQDVKTWQLVAEAKDAYHMLIDAGKITLTEEEFLEQLVDATKGRYIVQGNVINAADEEDLTVKHSSLLGVDTLKLADRLSTDGMGYIILRKNKTFVEQVTKPNTIYEIRYDFNLNDITVEIPQNSVLYFNGGSISKGTISLNKCLVSGDVHIYSNIIGQIRNKYSTPEMFGAIGNGNSDDTVAVQKALDSCNRIMLSARYKSGTVYVDRRDMSIYGGGIFEGTIDAGWTADKYESYHDLTDRQFNLNITDIRFSKTSVIGSEDDGQINNYIINAEFINSNKSIILHNIQGVKISHCYFSNVPFPISVKPNEARTVPRTINGITYNKARVNQNVSRVMINNCDFELCHTGIYVPSIVKDSLEYGDININFCNFHPTHKAIVFECVDGTKIYNSVFYTGARNTKAWNIDLLLCGQIVIEGCSLYGEYNDGSIKMKDPGCVLIEGCSFNSIGTVYGPVDIEKAVAIDIKSKEPSYIQGLSIRNNSFSNVKKLPIKVVGNARDVIIEGNKRNSTFISKDYYYNLAPLYYLKVVNDNYDILLQENVNGQLTYLYESITQVNIRYKALHLYWTKANLYNSARSGNIDVYRGDNNSKFFLKDVKLYKPITVLNCANSFESCKLYFNGVLLTITFTSTEISEKLITLRDALFSKFSDYTFEIIDNLLWCVGSNEAECIAPAYSPENKIRVVWQNLGCSVKLKDIDGKNFINTIGGYPYIYSAIDSNDNGKIFTDSKGTYILKCKANDNINSKLNIRSRSVGYSYIWTYDDFFYGAGPNGVSDNDEICSKILKLAFSESHSFDGTTLTTLEAGNEYGYEVKSQNTRYVTHDVHIADIEYFGENSGSARPTGVSIGYMFFDTVLNKPIYWTGTKWVDATGVDV